MAFLPPSRLAGARGASAGGWGGQPLLLLLVQPQDFAQDGGVVGCAVASRNPAQGDTGGARRGGWGGRAGFVRQGWAHGRPRAHPGELSNTKQQPHGAAAAINSNLPEQSWGTSPPERACNRVDGALHVQQQPHGGEVLLLTGRVHVGCQLADLHVKIHVFGL